MNNVRRNTLFPVSDCEWVAQSGGVCRIVDNVIYKSCVIQSGDCKTDVAMNGFFAGSIPDCNFDYHGMNCNEQTHSNNGEYPIYDEFGGPKLDGNRIIADLSHEMYEGCLLVFMNLDVQGTDWDINGSDVKILTDRRWNEGGPLKAYEKISTQIVRRVELESSASAESSA